jgi:predicted esterase
MCGRFDECLLIIGGILDKGYPFPLSFKRFDPLREKEAYRQIKGKNEALLKKAKASADIAYKVFVPESCRKDKKYPLFIALHGHGICSIEEFSAYWKPDVFTKRGFIFAYLQSSQVLCHNGYGWMDDYEKAVRDIEKGIKAIAAEYPVDETSVIIGGFSGGAIAAVNFAMSGIKPVNGFLCVCPEEKPPAFTRENVRKAAGSGMRGVFMEGELVLPIADEDEMRRIFSEEGLPCEYYVNKGIGHETPDDLDAKLEQALKFIREGA